MGRYFEYTVPAKATKQERLIQIGLWLLVPVFVGLGFFRMVLWIGALAAGAAAFWYGSQLTYEYEYILNGDELEVAKVINLSRRKELAQLPLGDMELFTDDPALIQPYLKRPNVKVMNWSALNHPVYTIVINDSGRIKIYNLSLSKDMADCIYRWFPMKAKMKK